MSVTLCECVWRCSATKLTEVCCLHCVCLILHCIWINASVLHSVAGSIFPSIAQWNCVWKPSLTKFASAAFEKASPTTTQRTTKKVERTQVSGWTGFVTSPSNRIISKRHIHSCTSKSVEDRNVRAESHITHTVKKLAATLLTDEFLFSKCVLAKFAKSFELQRKGPASQ